MNKQEILDRVKEAIADVLEIDVSQIGMDTKMEDIQDLDSVAYMTIIATIEMEFEIEIDLEKIVKMKLVGEVVEEISNKI